MVIAAREGRLGAQDALVRRWLPDVLQWSRRLTRRGVHPDDVAQEAMMIALTRLHKLREPASFKGWLYGIVKNVIVAHGRRAWLRKWVPGLEAPVMPDPAADPVQVVASKQASLRIREVLDLLSDAHREVIVLCEIEERTDVEVAELLGLPSGTVKSRLRRARLRFRELCEEHGLDVHMDGGAHEPA